MTKDYFDKIKEKTEQYYSERVSQGYRWEKNVLSEEVESTKSSFHLRGLEIFIGAIAFDGSGNILKQRISIFIKNKK